MNTPPLLSAPRAPVLALLALALPAILAASPLLAGGAASAPWSDEIVDLAARIPIQEGGRVKPLDTHARFTLLAINQKRSVAVESGGEARTLQPIEWWLDAVLRPELAMTYACFRIDNPEVLVAIGLDRGAGKKGADRYSYEELGPGLEVLDSLARPLARRDAKERDAVEAGIVSLWHDVLAFEALAHALDFARTPLRVPAGTRVAMLFPGRETISALEFYGKAAEARALVRELAPKGDPPPEARADVEAVRVLATAADAAVRASYGLSLIPPADPEVATWDSPADLLDRWNRGEEMTEAERGVLDALAALARVGGDPTDALAAVRTLQERTRDLAEARGEYGKVSLEVFFYRLNPFDRALWLYGLGFLSLVLWWATKNRWFARGVWGTILAALVLHGAGIVIRCILRDRPPVSTLYETILSISFLGVGVCALVERIHRMGIALSLAPILGALGLFVANRFEVRLGEDTMPQLVAVLDTNFWLSTHVVCITIGYAGGLLAAAVAHIFVLGRVLGIRRGDGAFYATVARLNYGMLCFGLFFAVVGTILGGIWANESWGRFWGWDPKENGALMICLTQIAILHARMGGYLKSFGVAMASIAGGVVIAFSWWGVNLLGIGLHSYGWTEGVSRALTIFYGFEGLILLAGFWHRLAPLRAPIAPP